MNTEPYWREVIASERDKGKSHLLMPLAAFETLLDRLDHAKNEQARLEARLNRWS
jgi:hypothetical protein